MEPSQGKAWEGMPRGPADWLDHEQGMLGGMALSKQQASKQGTKPCQHKHVGEGRPSRGEACHARQCGQADYQRQLRMPGWQSSWLIGQWAVSRAEQLAQWTAANFHLLT